MHNEADRVASFAMFTQNAKASNCSNLPEHLMITYLVPMYTAEFAIGFPSNLLVILVYIFCLPSWRSTNVYMFNLAISDLICLCTLLVVSYNYMHQHVPLGPVGCVVTRYILHVNLYASILFMMWVGVDRLLLLLYPQRNHFLLTQKGSFFISFINWIWVTIEITPHITFVINDLKESNWTKCNDFGSLHETTPVLIYSFLLTIVGYLLPLLALILISSSMVSLLKKREEVFGTSFQRPVRIIKAAVVMLLVLYMPYHVMRNVRLASQLPGLGLLQCEAIYIEATYIITRPIAFAHSVVNPVFYVLMTDRFKEVLQDKWKQFKRLAKLKGLS